MQNISKMKKDFLITAHSMAVYKVHGKWVVFFTFGMFSLLFFVNTKVIKNTITRTFIPEFTFYVNIVPNILPAQIPL